MEDGLTMKQKIFINEYVISGGNATKAARIAYRTKNDNVAGMIGSENLKKPKIVKKLRCALESSGIGDSFISFRLRFVIENAQTGKEVLDVVELYLRLTGR